MNLKQNQKCSINSHMHYRLAGKEFEKSRSIKQGTSTLASEIQSIVGEWILSLSVL
jgi:hypothetical protein